MSELADRRGARHVRLVGPRARGTSVKFLNRSC
jgi:hypothetical protein